MNPIHVNCPECQKLFMVETQSLADGQARFQCTGCEGFFAFNWPQPPDVQTVRSQSFDGKDFIPMGLHPKVNATIKTVVQKTLHTCVRCGVQSDVDYKECPKCGVLFERIITAKPPQPVVPPSGPEVMSAWDAVKSQYIDDKRHEFFILICLNRDNLAFASSQYRAILAVNPHDEIALRMQTRIIELATATYVATLQKPNKKQPLRVTGIITGVAGLLILLGLFLPQARGLVAVGCAILVFIFAFRNLNN
ncbi:MAG: hypothetical protein SGI74_10155 [Oligoflexia bacterium]|nr:hypothetical protein [Oligoflexia bacterium]